MPENKLENFVFTVIMAFHELIIMWLVAIILEMFIMEKPVMTLTSRVVTEEMPFFSCCWRAAP